MLRKAQENTKNTFLNQLVSTSFHWKCEGERAAFPNHEYVIFAFCAQQQTRQTYFLRSEAEARNMPGRY